MFIVLVEVLLGLLQALQNKAFFLYLTDRKQRKHVHDESRDRNIPSLFLMYDWLYPLKQNSLLSKNHIYKKNGLHLKSELEFYS